MLPLLEQEAAKRRDSARREQAARGKEGGRGKQKPPTQKIGERVKHEGEAAAVAASITGTNRQYVADAKKLKQEDQAEYERVPLLVVVERKAIGPVNLLTTAKRTRARPPQ